MTDRIPVMNAADDPESMETIQNMIALMRMAVIPLLPDSDDLPQAQSHLITAAATMAGMTAGHMLAFGAMKPGDQARAVKVVTVAFRSGIKLGKDEAHRAILAQSPVEGSA